VGEGAKVDGLCGKQMGDAQKSGSLALRVWMKKRSERVSSLAGQAMEGDSDCVGNRRGSPSESREWRWKQRTTKARKGYQKTGWFCSILGVSGADATEDAVYEAEEAEYACAATEDRGPVEIGTRYERRLCSRRHNGASSGERWSSQLCEACRRDC
jgi:hypothetical protein